MYRVSKNTRKSIAGAFNLIIALQVMLLISVITFGCTQTKSLEPSGAAIPVAPSESRPVSSGKYRAVALADLDNDGNLDVVAGGSFPAALAISYGDGRGGMSRPQHLYLKGEVQSIAVTDVNEDGLKDVIISVQKGASGLKIWLNRSSRQWILARGPVEINDYQGLASADINGDGIVDYLDFGFFASRWLDLDCQLSDNCDGTDLDYSGQIVPPFRRKVCHRFS